MNIKNTTIPQRGIYRVGNKEFYEKIPALLHATKTKEQVSWDYGDEYFSQFNWSIEPKESLTELYTERCQQLRDKYSYIVLYYSGGADSHNILTHFQKANIHIDEIVSYWPIKYFESRKKANASKENTELQNEWFYTAKPDLARIKQEMPNTKLTIIDTTDSILGFDIADTDQWLEVCGEHINIAGQGHRLIRYTTDTMLNLYDKQTVGHIHGIDKPRVFRIDNNWYFSFLDSVMNLPPKLPKNQLEGAYTEVEHFYWSKDSVKLLTKQAHEIKNFFTIRPEIKCPSNKGLNFEERQRYDDFVRQIIYPYWRSDAFQINKPQSVFMCETDEWVFNERSDIKDRWTEIYSNIVTSVDNEFMQTTGNHDTPDSFNGFWSKWHQL